ncbi:hypothetical protein BT69DRAFT_782088 [Atractiella rhizophila]|nr:hypothetical protein BT69DRAFT_782088 [Atractiella rhizophila]
MLATGVAGLVTTNDPNDTSKILLGTSPTHSTQFYLFLNTNSSSSAQNSTQNGTLAQPATFAANEQVVELRLPILNSTDMSSSLTCATFSANPPSKLQLAPCGAQPEGYSQSFAYDSSSGQLKPFYAPGVRLVANDANSTAANSTSNSTLPIAQSLVQTLSSNSTSDSNSTGSTLPSPQSFVDANTSDNSTTSSNTAAPANSSNTTTTATGVQLYFIPADKFFAQQTLAAGTTDSNTVATPSISASSDSPAATSPVTDLDATVTATDSSGSAPTPMSLADTKGDEDSADDETTVGSDTDQSAADSSTADSSDAEMSDETETPAAADTTTATYGAQDGGQTTTTATEAPTSASGSQYLAECDASSSSSGLSSSS